MWAQIGKNKVNLGFKSYTCYCTGLLDKGILARTEANKVLLETKVTKALLAFTIARWLGSHKATELYSLIVDKSYSLLSEGIKTPITVAMICLLVERCSLTPKGLNHLSRIEDRDRWLYLALEELIQYPPSDKLDPIYISMSGGALEFYTELATFHPDLDILPEQLVFEVIKEYISQDTNTTILNSIDEAGILIKLEEGFTWSDKSIKNRLLNYPFRQRQWARANKLIKQVTQTHYELT